MTYEYRLFIKNFTVLKLFFFILFSFKEESPSISVAGTVVGIAAAAAVGYVICTKIPIKTVVTTSTMIYKAYQGYQELSRNFNNNNNVNNNMNLD
jgi:hypothetical protein